MYLKLPLLNMCT